MKKIILSALSACVLFSSPASAGCGTQRCTGERVLELYPHTNGNINVRMSGNIGQLNCALESDKYIVLAHDAVLADEIFSILLTAMTADKPIHTVRISENTAPCSLAYVIQTP